MVALAQRQIAPATYLGWQSGVGAVSGFALYNLTEDIEGHPAGSTVTAKTLLAAGYAVPNHGLLPAPLPTAAQCPPSLVFLEVTRHPSGGWTHAEPIDATKSTTRIYRGWWRTRSAAVGALDRKFSP